MQYIIQPTTRCPSLGSSHTILIAFVVPAEYFGVTEAFGRRENVIDTHARRDDTGSDKFFQTLDDKQVGHLLQHSYRHTVTLGTHTRLGVELLSAVASAQRARLQNKRGRLTGSDGGTKRKRRHSCESCIAYQKKAAWAGPLRPC